MATKSRAIAVPTTMPPAATSTNWPVACTSENVPVSAATTANRYRTRPEASFTRLSPSIRVTIRRGTFMRDMIAVAATASGGETMAPNANATAQGSSGTSHLSVAATATVVAMTRPTARSEIEPRFARKSRQDVKSAAW